jgi:trehalose-6-phosphatase
MVQQRSPDFVFCAGDDRTDEDMFRVLSLIAESSVGDDKEGASGRSAGKRSTSVTTCVIGPANKRSSASTRLESPLDLILVLESLTVA